MRTFSLLFALAGMAGSASASFITFNTFGDLQAGATLAFSDDFQSYTTGKNGTTMGTQGITFTQMEAGTLDVTLPLILENTTKCVTNCLTADGNEDFKIELTSNNLFTAIGFDMVTNDNLTPLLQVYGAGGLLIGNYTVPLGHNTLGFVGLVSDVPISYVRLESVGGDLQDTAIDNVFIGQAGASGAPEPALGLSGTGGLLVLLAVIRRRGIAPGKFPQGTLSA